MTNGGDSDTIPPSDAIEDVLSRARQLDPTIDAAAVRRYAREMAEAVAVLNTVDLGDAALVVAFSASWPEGYV